MDIKYTMAGMILSYLPDFCWQDYMEIVTMLEEIDLNINPQSIQVNLSKLSKQGRILVKISKYKHVGPNGRVFMYRKNPDYIAAE